LACALACNGMTVAGIENQARRVTSARRLRSAVVEVWPEVADRYHIIRGFYPRVLMDRSASGWLPWRRPALAGPWLGAGASLVFTNVSYGWSEEVLADVIDSMQRFAAVILDLRLFGIVREADTERAALFDRIAGAARSAERLPALSSGSHFARFVFGT